jgi:hypothetical protein
MKATQTNTSDGIESTDLEQRDVRALTEYLTVVPEAPGLYTVMSQSGHEYTVDIETGACTCPDARHRDPDGGCKHARRVAFETGAEAIPAWVDPDALPSDFAAHVDETPRVAATDGGSAEWTERASALDDGSDVVVAGDEGVVLDEDDDERPDDCQCVDWNSDTVDLPCWPCYCEGHDGPNPEAPGDEEDDTPRRSEPADFGGGETTGVQDL